MPLPLLLSFSRSVVQSISINELFFSSSFFSFHFMKSTSIAQFLLCTVERNLNHFIACYDYRHRRHVRKCVFFFSSDELQMNILSRRQCGRMQIVNIYAASDKELDRIVIKFEMASFIHCHWLPNVYAQAHPSLITIYHNVWHSDTQPMCDNSTNIESNIFDQTQFVEINNEISVNERINRFVKRHQSICAERIFSWIFLHLNFA